MQCKLIHEKFFRGGVLKWASIFCLCSSLILVPFSITQAESRQYDQSIMKHLYSHISSNHHLPLSYHVPDKDREKLLLEMGAADSIPGIIERVIVTEGTSVYDSALWQIVMTHSDQKKDIELAEKIVDIYWKGSFGHFQTIRGGHGQGYVYDPSQKESVSSDLTKFGERGFLFRIFNGYGKYLTSDPLDGKKELSSFPNFPQIHWQDWKPIAGENAWAVIAALHIYHKKYYNSETQSYDHPKNSIELNLVKELTRAAMILQSDIGGIRMAPLGTFSSDENGLEWYYNEISTENNISWYAALRMLYQITGEQKYQDALNKINDFFHFVWNDSDKYFYQGAHFENGQWHPNKKHFATDVQTWGISVLSPLLIDNWFGENSAYQMWQSTKQEAGSSSDEGHLSGVGFTQEKDQISVEWTAGAILAVRNLEDFYSPQNQTFAQTLSTDENQMRKSLEKYRFENNEATAYSYSKKRKWIPFGWFSHQKDITSLASTAWIIFIDNFINPFKLN